MNKAIEIVKALQGLAPEQTTLLIAVVVTDAPPQLVLSGSELPLDAAFFEIPVSFESLAVGDRFFALPVKTRAGDRYGLVTRLNR